MIRRGARALRRFWWDFLVGDTPEFFVVTLLIVALAYGLRHHRDVGVVVLPVVVLGALATSVGVNGVSIADATPDARVLSSSSTDACR